MAEHEREQIEATLFPQIGQLKMENDYLQKITDGLVGDKYQLIEPIHNQLSISQHCDSLNISRAHYYYRR